MVTYVNDSHYDGGPTPPENTSFFNAEIVDDSYIQIGSADFQGTIRSGTYLGVGDPETTGSFHKLTPDLGEGVTVAVDLSEVAAGYAFQVGVYSHAPPDIPDGAETGSVVGHQALVTIFPDNHWEFAWAGWRWLEAGDPYEMISPQGKVEGSYDPESMHYLSICFDGSAASGGYWALKVGGTLSALHIPTGAMPTHPPDSEIMYVSHLARTHHPIWMEDFVAWATAERGFAEMPYWDVNGQDVILPFGWPWAVAMEDGWHGTENLVAGRYDVGPTDVDWARTYPVRLG
jgi:hypothetical protein